GEGEVGTFANGSAAGTFSCQDTSQYLGVAREATGGTGGSRNGYDRRRSRGRPRAGPTAPVWRRAGVRRDLPPVRPDGVQPRPTPLRRRRPGGGPDPGDLPPRLPLRRAVPRRLQPEDLDLPHRRQPLPEQPRAAPPADAAAVRGAVGGRVGERGDPRPRPRAGRAGGRRGRGTTGGRGARPPAPELPGGPGAAGPRR